MSWLWFLRLPQLRLVPLIIAFPLALLAQDSAKSIADTLVQAREKIEEGQPTEGLALLDQALAAATGIEGQNLSLRERLLFEAASANLEFAGALKNREQYRVYAGKARRQFLDYTKWFAGLSSADKKLVANRTQTVTAFLGNADLRMEDQRKLFEDYSNIPDVTFLGTDAIELWKNTLYTCPDWQPVSPDERGDLRRRKICSDSCTEDWRVYASTLEDWAKSFPLRTTVKESKLREAGQIKEIAEHCPQE